MKKILLFLIYIYQKNPFKKTRSCVFIPTCSEYTKDAIIKYGSIKGLYLGIRRVLRCHPWQKKYYDPLK